MSSTQFSNPESQYALLLQIKKALQKRIEIIADHTHRNANAASHMKSLQVVSQKIIDLQSQLPSNTDAQFKHYLERCSYDKALVWIEKYLS